MMPLGCNKSFRTMVVYLLMIQLLLHSTAISGNNNTTNNPSGAEFLKNVIGNLHRPNRKIINDRIDVEEHIPNDVPNIDQNDEIKILSKQPYNYNFNLNGQNNQGNNPTVDVNKNQDEPSFFSQLFPQFSTNEFSDTQNRIVSQGPGGQSTQQYTSIPSNSLPPHIVEALSSGTMKPDGTIGGYNYFFYPLDNKEVQQLQQQNGMQPTGNGQGAGSPNSLESAGPANQVTKPKVEPLFVAMAGFVGVAVVFLSALMFIPRLPIPVISSKGVLKRAPEELASLTRLVAESIDGKDCSERIACEVGRAMRSLQVGTKPIRMMEIILPPAVAKQLAQIRRSASKKEQCHFIMCKRTEGTLKLVAKLKKTHNKTIHDVKEIFNI